MPVTRGGNHVHHHGPLAGAGAGAVAVLVLMLAAWRQVSHSASVAVPVLTWAVVAVVIAAAAYAVGYLFLRLRHHVRYPESLLRPVVRAEVIPAGDLAVPVSPAIPAAAPVAAIEPADWRATRWAATPVNGQEIPR